MEPGTATAFATAVLSAGGKAAELGKVFLTQLGDEESKFLLFFKNLARKPIVWLFTVIFSPFILIMLFFRGAKNTKGIGLIEKIRLFVMTCGIAMAVCSTWIMTTYFGTIAFLFFLRTYFGPITALSWLAGTFFSVSCTIAAQIIVFNLTCWLFIHLSKPWVIEKVMEQNAFSPNPISIEKSEVERNQL